jgi:GNAT superfamily N-acetyltransferase
MLTHPDFRHRGIGRSVMQRGTEFMWQELQPQLGLLLSPKMAIPFYEHLGWEVFKGPILCEQPGRTINYTEWMPQTPAMILTLTGSKLSISHD